MKKIYSLLLVIFVLFLASCNNYKNNYEITNSNFETFYNVSSSFSTNKDVVSLKIEVSEKNTTEYKYQTDIIVNLNVYYKYDNNIVIDLGSINESLIFKKKKSITKTINIKSLKSVDLFYIEIKAASGSISTKEQVEVKEIEYHLPDFKVTDSNSMNIEDAKKNEELKLKFLNDLKTFKDINLTNDSSISTTILNLNANSIIGIPLEQMKVVTKETTNYKEVSFDGSKDLSIYETIDNLTTLKSVSYDETDGKYYVDESIVENNDLLGFELLDILSLINDFDHTKVLIENNINTYRITGFIKDFVPSFIYNEIIKQLGQFISVEELSRLKISLVINIGNDKLVLATQINFNLNNELIGKVSLDLNQTFEYKEFEKFDLNKENVIIN